MSNTAQDTYISIINFGKFSKGLPASTLPYPHPQPEPNFLLKAARDTFYEGTSFAQNLLWNPPRSFRIKSSCLSMTLKVLHNSVSLSPFLFPSYFLFICFALAMFANFYVCQFCSCLRSTCLSSRVLSSF